MKITAIEMIPLHLEMLGTATATGPNVNPEEQMNLPPEEIAKLRYTPPETVLVRIKTDAGLEGLGDGATLPHYFGHGIGSMMDWLGRFRSVLIGCDPLNIAGIHRAMEGVASIGVPGCRPAQAAIDMAIYDLAGKAHDCPVYELLGGALRTELELQTQMHGYSLEQLLGVCHHYLDQGFTGLKLKIGGQLRREGYSKALVDEEAEKIAGVVGHLPGTVQVDVDANQGLMNAKVAIGLFENVRRIAHHPNMSIEQPLHHLDLAGHALIRRVLPYPVILDEAVTSPAAMIQIVRMQAADRIVLKPNRVGGLWPALKIIDICEANGIGVSLDTMPFTVLGDTMLCHLGATIRTHYPLDAEGHTFFRQTPFVGGISLSDGRARIPDAPGFGITVDENRLSAMSVQLKVGA
ncbi:mandelate racemase/muconate lactonizing enzyme family protein [Devosia rhodophyticola]|uniref:Mandelate racemase/muconate lactonizing enzyme family protein n=1 Tax=Devosia rhodophyticola TaxID=3026423 RepID=A0ABY7YUM3_9HYPH|nr:mandelate racemase/muconate lactonizing enzyme family protein [Devosia rhodophyticola]WDR04644.1 mandelate racemase/muconate lactonizing enzyme family protein [Devosia rhodophyticola]